jgi:hypothetical protein
MLVPSTGGTPTPIAPVSNAGGNCGAYQLAFDDVHGYVYWIQYADGVIARATLAGASAATVYSPGAYGISLAVDPFDVGYVYYRRYCYGGTPCNWISRVSSLGSDEVTFADTDSPCCQVLLADQGYLYWTDDSGGTVNEAPLRPASLPVTPYQLAKNEHGPGHPFLTATALYWLQLGAAGYVRFASLETAAPAASLNTTALENPIGLAVDADAAWVLTQGTSPDYLDGALYRIPIGGGAPVLVAGGLARPSSLSMDDAHLYWASNNTSGNTDGKIFMLVK